ncbi:MAG TPA: HAMP domain-containing sensor histidine kinase, partial [Cytophagaceae bacterium]
TQDTEVLLALMENSVIRFKSTILDLTEISKVQKEENEEYKEINLAQLLDDVKVSIHDQVTKSEANIETDFAEAPSIVFSKKNLKSIVYNLVSNAIKYKDPNRIPHINIKTQKAEGYTVLTIKDNGLGIGEANLDKVFSMFKRFHDHVEGTGIGLYIVKRIIDNAGGKIEVDSKVGEGSCFTIWLRD